MLFLAEYFRRSYLPEQLELALRTAVIDEGDPLIVALRIRLSQAFGEQSVGISKHNHLFETALDLMLTYGAGVLKEISRLGLLPASPRTLRRHFLHAQATNGVNIVLLKNFLRLCSEGAGAKWVADGSIRIACCLAIDGLALARDISYDEITDKFVGTVPPMTRSQIKDHVEDQESLLSWLDGTEWADNAHLHCLTTLCGSVTCPIAVYYTPHLRDAHQVG